MKFEIDKTKGEKYKLPCKNCDNKTYHIVLHSVDESDSNENVDFYFKSYQIIQCQGCEEVSFRTDWVCSEDMDYDPETGEAIALGHEELFPSRIAGRKELKDVYYLPYEVSRIYKETHSAICSKMPVLAGIGIRSLVEAVCNEREAVGKNLEEKIDNLIQMGILTKDGAEILHSTRLLGNKATHEVKPLGEQTLDAAMDVAEYLLKGVYILQKKTEKLPKRENK